MANGRLYLVPSLLGAIPPESVLPALTLEVARNLRHFVAENPKVARAFLKTVGLTVPLQQIDIVELNEHTPPAHVAALLGPALGGLDIGLLSDAGCPAVADPGAGLVAAAHRSGIRVIPMVGPSSILLALMASGMNGQGFTFHGYLPVKAEARVVALRKLDAAARSTAATQLFIEAPYRNVAMLNSIIEVCSPDTLLAVAADLTLATEEVAMMTIAAWRKRDTDGYQNRPAIFLLGSPNRR